MVWAHNNTRSIENEQEQADTILQEADSIPNTKVEASANDQTNSSNKANNNELMQDNIENRKRIALEALKRWLVVILRKRAIIIILIMTLVTPRMKTVKNKIIHSQNRSICLQKKLSCTII